MSVREPLYNLDKARGSRRRYVQPEVISFPVGGWDAASPLANMPQDRAVQLLNWRPEPGFGEIRKGYAVHCDTLTGTPVETLATWMGTTSSKLFACSGGNIINATTGTPANEVTGLASNRWQWVNFSNPGGHYLWMANGQDDCRYTDGGGTWTVPTLAFGDATVSSDIVNCNVHKNRIWLIKQNSLDVYFMPTFAIQTNGDQADIFPLGAIFDRGGNVLAMATWTRDGGAGSDDFAVFVTDQGQAAVYQGTDPASAGTWGLVGVFDIPVPIGYRCFRKYGADVLLVTNEGVYPLGTLLGIDRSQATRTAVTDNIRVAVNDAVRRYGGQFGWEIIAYPRRTQLILNVPQGNNLAQQFIMNTLTGAWCEYNNHNANTWVIYQDRLYFGDYVGNVMLADEGSTDNGANIVAIGQTAYSGYGTPNLKRFMQIKPLITASGGTSVEVGISVDFVETGQLSAINASLDGVSLWNTATWQNELGTVGDAVWASGTNNVSFWLSVGVYGTYGSVKFQASTTGSTGNDEIIRVNAMITTVEQGALI